MSAKPRSQWSVDEILAYARKGEEARPTWDRSEALARAKQLGSEGRDQEVDEVLDGLEAASETAAQVGSGDPDTGKGTGPSTPDLEDLDVEGHIARKYGEQQ